MSIEIIPVNAGHARAWRELYKAYMIFYKVPIEERILENMWSWLMDPSHEEQGLVVVEDGAPVGLAHFRRMPNPLFGGHSCFLDDLFVSPAARGGRIGEALINRVAEIAKQNGWPLLEWITAQDNYRARTLYDRLAKQGPWIQYEMDLG